jgi:hypothetical protein
MAKLLFIGLFWILIGVFVIFARTFETNEVAGLISSLDFIFSFTISILSIVIGICFIFKKKWSHKAMLYLSKVLILGILCLGIKMTTYGILDLYKMRSLASSIGLLFGIIVFLSAIPFFVGIACIKSDEIKNYFFESLNFKKSLFKNQQNLFVKKHRKLVRTITFLSCFVGLVAVTIVISSLDKILYWDEIIDFGEYSISVRDWGKGEPTVIIEGGLAQEKDKYFLISFFCSAITRTIAYDHAGVGNSTKSPYPRLLPNYVEEFRRLIKKKDIRPPFIFVGHSSGGHIIRYYTHLYPSEVLGIVFIDVPHEDWFKHIRENWGKEEITKYFKWWYPENQDMDIRNMEKSKYEENCYLIRGKILPQNIPVLMFIGNNTFHFRKDEAGMKEDMKVWADQQSSIVKKNDNAEVIIDWETGHYPFKDKPLMIVRNINKFIKKIKNGTKAGVLQ